jgi:hypothetical protein
VERPQGVVIRVHIDAASKLEPGGSEAEPRSVVDAHFPQATPDIAPIHPPMLGTGAVVTPMPRALSRVTRAEQARAEMTIALMSATASQVLTPFMKELEMTRELSERQSVEIRQQAELIGRLSSDLDNAREIIREMKVGDRSQRGQTQWIMTIFVFTVILLAAMIAAGVTVWLTR